MCMHVSMCVRVCVCGHIRVCRGIYMCPSIIHYYAFLYIYRSLFQEEAKPEVDEIVLQSTDQPAAVDVSLSEQLAADAVIDLTGVEQTMVDGAIAASLG